MPSVYAHWSGPCRDAHARRELLGYVEQLGQVSQSFFDAPPLVRYEGAIRGRIAVSHHLFATPPTSPRFAPLSDGLSLLESATLEGIEFRLYDGRGLYPGEDRVSFVFLRDPDPALDGHLVYVENQAECRQYRDPAIQSAEWYLGVPNLHLRYYLEEWLDLLMGWVKHYFIPDLRYWRHDDRLTDPRLLRDTFGALSAAQTFPVLLDSFRAEVSEWVDRAAYAREFYATLGRPVSLLLPDAGAAPEATETAIAEALQRAVRHKLGDTPVDQALDALWGSSRTDPPQ